jgi:polyphosphate glucokinase
MQVTGRGEAEKWTSAHVRTAEKLDWPAWIERVNVYLAELYALFWPDLFILGGAVSERFEEFAPLLRSDAQIKPAAFAGQAGVIGAALAAADA